MANELFYYEENISQKRWSSWTVTMSTISRRDEGRGLKYFSNGRTIKRPLDLAIKASNGNSNIFIVKDRYIIMRIKRIR